jgi:hypothetical protein
MRERPHRLQFATQANSKEAAKNSKRQRTDEPHKKISYFLPDLCENLGPKVAILPIHTSKIINVEETNKCLQYLLTLF